MPSLQKGFSLAENPSLERQARSKAAHARTQSELPANIKLSLQHFVGSTKKSIQLKEDSPLFEKDSQLSDKEDSAAIPTPPVESAASLNSNFKSKQGSSESRLGGPVSVHKSTKFVGKKSPLLDDNFIMALQGITHPDFASFPDSKNNPKTVTKKFDGLLDWPPVPHHESRTEHKAISRESPKDFLERQTALVAPSGGMDKREFSASAHRMPDGVLPTPSELFFIDKNVKRNPVNLKLYL